MRVVITGIGAVTPLGLNFPETWKRIKNNESGISKLTRFNPDDYLPQRFCHVAGQVDIEKFRELVPGLGIASAKLPKIDLFVLFGVAAAKEAVFDSGCLEADICEAGVIAGSAFGGAETIFTDAGSLFKKKRVRPCFVPAMITSAAASQVSILLGAKGGAYSLNGACASGSQAIGEAFEKVRSGRWKTAVVLGTDACLTPLNLAALGNMREACSQSLDPSKASRPFDKNRDGFVPSEGAGALVLEEYCHAVARGAKIYAEVTGYGLSTDATDMVLSDPAGLENCIKSALADARMAPGEIDYVNAHGTATRQGDANEALAIKNVFAKKVPLVSSTKSQLGHMMAAAGVVELAITVLAMREGIIPPTINLEVPDPDCGPIDFVPNSARRMCFAKACMSCSFGFGGLNAALIVKKI